MTAEAAGHIVWTPDPTRQRLRAYTVEDVFKLPDDTPRVELTDGVLSVVPSPNGGHQRINWRLVAWLDRHAPEDMEASLAVGVVIGYRNTLEPDALLLRRPVDYEHHFYEPSQVVLAVEIVSPGTKRRDRLQKPALYAAAGIPHFWRIEQNPLHLFAYDLVDGRYELVADSADELVLTAPFEIKLPIADIAP
ncbi:Uma2 family endonuclease [Jidongwangia harbinensis]|uniref:Uma2 family endonuclease n=1 Tax=Jidongwangia harbinensis TaxID=2878561 RepID=UPI001CDA0E93|nr:Uma2 family endonuclease [Jidongwangia harbinensis]MCA2213844.1 Uma2 family endonuclease [Jidongwangia harbinensis]